MSHSRPDPSQPYPTRQPNASDGNVPSPDQEEATFEDLDPYLDYQPSASDGGPTSTRVPRSSSGRAPAGSPPITSKSDLWPW